MKKRYRIVTDEYLGFEVQSKVWYWPFWIQVKFTNTHSSIKDAEEWVKDGCPNQREESVKIVKYL